MLQSVLFHLYHSDLPENAVSNYILLTFNAAEDLHGKIRQVITYSIKAVKVIREINTAFMFPRNPSLVENTPDGDTLHTVHLNCC